MVDETVVSSTYKILGELTDDTGAGVLGKNSTSSGTPIGVEGTAPDGYGLSTPDDARIQGLLDTAETDFVVEAGTMNTGKARNVVLGHENNSVGDSVEGATIAGGGRDDGTFSAPNVVDVQFGTIGGGFGNTTGNSGATIPGGINNTASGPSSTVIGGSGNTASGELSAAGGHLAETETSGGTSHDGAFVWGDSSSTTVRSSANDQVIFQAGGTRTSGTAIALYSQSDGSTGVKLPANDGTWTSLSSRAAKSDIDPVTGSDVLETVDEIAVSTWRYEGQDSSVRHMGPMAEEFTEAFGLGTDETTIAPLDTAGVALAAIQGLSSKLDAKDDRIRGLEAENDRKDDRIDELEGEMEQFSERLATLETQVATAPAPADD